MKTVNESRSRSAVKAVTYRIAIMASDAIAVYFLTKRMDYALGVMGITGVLNTLLYISHERVWNRIHWGRTFLSNKNVNKNRR